MAENVQQQNGKYAHIGYIKGKYAFESLKEAFGKFSGLKVLVIGDAIIDEYHFVIPKGRATKDPILSTEYVKQESYAGGILAIANHVSNFVKDVLCVTFVGDREDRKDFIAGSMNRNVRLKFFVKENSPTITKRRYLDNLRNEKLFKVEYINDTPISGACEREFVSFLEQELPKYDIVMVGDFGHGVITEAVIKALEEKSRYLAVNAQSNSSNLGFNYITRYHSPDFISMDTYELRYAVADKFSEIPVLMNKLFGSAGYGKFLVTMSKMGSGYFNHGSMTFSPAFVTRPQDTVGAGDAVFAIVTLFAYSGMDELIPFIANCVGGVAVSYLGNKESVDRQKVLAFIRKVYDGEMEVH